MRGIFIYGGSLLKEKREIGKVKWKCINPFLNLVIMNINTSIKTLKSIKMLSVQKSYDDNLPDIHPSFREPKPDTLREWHYFREWCGEDE